MICSIEDVLLTSNDINKENKKEDINILRDRFKEMFWKAIKIPFLWNNESVEEKKYSKFERSNESNF